MSSGLPSSPNADPCNAAIGVADAEYVLRWLKQSGAPENVTGLQERALRIFIATESERYRVKADAQAAVANWILPAIERLEQAVSS